MALRTVLVLLDTESDAGRLTRFAASLPLPSDRDRAVLVGAHAAPSTAVSGAMADAVGGGAAGRGAETGRALRHAIRERFVGAAEACGLAWRWDDLLDAHRGPATTLRERARGADLVVLPQPPRDRLERLLQMGLRDVIVRGGRPALLVPAIERLESLGDRERERRRALIGWTPVRESTRAAHDAIALLGPGSRATLLWASRPGDPTAGVEASARAVAECLRRHDIDTDVARWPGADIPTGDVLLNVAFERGADFLVTGAWSHSRVHDALFGAVTAHLLEHPTLPVLFSH